MIKYVLVLTVWLLPLAAAAQVDNFGALDTLFAEVAKIDNNNWSITVSYFNDQPVLAFSVPLKMTAGTTRIVADSAVYAGGRVEHFDYKGFRADTAIQCATMGIIANLSPTTKEIPAGNGRLLTVFVSSLDGNPIEKLVVDTTTTQPNNTLMVIASKYQGNDTISVENDATRKIIPAFVCREPK